MYALAINGSPRKGGNTEFLLNTVLEPLAEQGWKTENLQIGANKVRGCIACYKCWESKDYKCAVKNDSFNEIFAKMLEADAIIIGSPTYFASVTAETKALLDRSGFVSRANGNAFFGKIGAAVVAMRRGGGVPAFDTINHMYQISGMILPGSIYWNQGIGMEKGAVAEDTEGVDTMKQLGKTIAWLGKAMKPHMQSFPR